MLNKINISFNKTECLSEQILKQYQAGLLPKDKIREVELHLADCEMCSDYIEGLSLLANSKELETETDIIISKLNKRTKKNRIWMYASAASIFIAISLSSIILFIPSKNKYVADNSITYQKNNIPDETKPQDVLGLEKNNSETVADELSEKEKSKIIDKSPLIDNTKSLNGGISQEGNKRNTGDYRAEISGEIISQKNREQDQTIVSNDNVTVNDESKGIVADIATKESLKTETSTAKVLAEEDIEKQAKHDDEKVSLLAKSESSKDKKSDEKRSESPNKNAPAMLEQNMLVSGAVSGYENISSDLDDANFYLSKQKNDSAIVYALRGTKSTNDSIKWKSKLCLAKAYLASGENEKAVEIFKEIKEKAKGSSKKDAEKELKKLGY